MVAQRRSEREAYVAEASGELASELDKGRYRGGDLGSREALLLHLREDGEAGQGVQRDLRPHGDARDRGAVRARGPGRLLRGARDHPLAVEAHARSLQGLRGHAEAEPLPVVAHDRDRPEESRSRSRCARARCTRRPSSASPRTGSGKGAPGSQGRGRAARLAEAAPRLAAGGDRRRRVHADVPCGSPRGRGVRVHAEGESSRCPPARPRSTSPTRCTRTSGTEPSARRSTGASSPSTTSSRAATSSRS